MFLNWGVRGSITELNLRNFSFEEKDDITELLPKGFF